MLVVIYMHIIIQHLLSSVLRPSDLKMESHFSLAFDNLSSYDGGKIRKGLRQIEGLLAQICLSKNKTTAAERRRLLVSPGNGAQTGPKDLSALREDAAFREFFKLQDGFEWNGMF